MFEMIYEIWRITDAFFAQLIVFGDDNNSIDDDDLPYDENYNIYNGDLDKSSQS